MFKFITPLGEIAIILLGHASLLIEWEEKKIFVDPYSEVADFSLQPKADLILLTHHHYDHLDMDAINKIATDKTVFVSNQSCKGTLPHTNVLRQGEKFTYEQIEIKAVYAYNIVNKRDDGHPFHPRGEGNGYILNFGGYRLYIAGDTELIPEMNSLGEIDLAFLPKNLPYTMSDEMFINAVNVIMPKNLFAYHFFEIDIPRLKASMPQGVILHNKD
ncbi:MAG: MBL fold metallo-hydrolase [Bacteroidales bacterium]